MSKSDKTVYERFTATARRVPDRPFLCILEETANIYAISPGEITYGEARQAVLQWQTKLQKSGLRAGSRVMLLLENRPDFFILWMACNALGASVVPLNPDLRQAELGYMMSHAEPVLTITVEKYRNELQKAAQSVSFDMPIIGINETLPVLTNAASAIQQSRPLHCEAALLYTSGTTGNPKGCVLSNRYFLKEGDWYANIGGLCTLSDDGERMLTPLPLFHMNAMACSFMAMLTVGGCLIMLDRFHPSSWWDSVRQSRATCLHYLGVMPGLLMAAESSELDKMHEVRFGFGAGIDPKLHAPFEERFAFPLVEAWAMTETGAGAVIAANRHPRKVGVSCFGRPENDVEIRIVDEHNMPVQPEEAGELLVRARGSNARDGFFTQYYKNEQATNEAWAGGWFHTGDIVRQDKDGDMFFVDRKKNVIRRSGENIAAVEVESHLMRHPKIAGVGVAAVADSIRGDEVFAMIVPESPVTQSSQTMLADDIMSWALEQMAYYKTPGYIAFVEKLPLTATQKIQRAELKKMAARLMENPQIYNGIHRKKRQSLA